MTKDDKGLTPVYLGQITEEDTVAKLGSPGARKVAPVFIGRKVLVRCLGPGPEHTFWSDDRCRHRICPKCARVVNGEGYTRPSTIKESSIKSDGRVQRHKKGK